MQIKFTDEGKRQFRQLRLIGLRVDVSTDLPEHGTDLIRRFNVFEECGRVRTVAADTVLSRASRLGGVGNNQAFWVVDLGQSALD